MLSSDVFNWSFRIIQNKNFQRKWLKPLGGVFIREEGGCQHASTNVTSSLYHRFVYATMMYVAAFPCLIMLAILGETLIYRDLILSVCGKASDAYGPVVIPARIGNCILIRHHQHSIFELKGCAAMERYHILYFVSWCPCTSTIGKRMVGQS